MKNLAQQAKNRTDKKLAAREAELIADTRIDWDAIKPKLSDPEEQQLLMEAVVEAKNRNENLGQLHKRLKALGSKGVTLADKLTDLL